MSTRSRRGCIDCRRSKIKCDEVHPTCGTCKRRKMKCHGYITASSCGRQGTSALSTSVGRAASLVHRSSSRSHTPSEGNLMDISRIGFAIPVTNVADSKMPLLRDISPIPPGMIRPSDMHSITAYFNRHPYDLVIGPEFVKEMNANTFLALQHDPTAVADSLFAIGHVYLVEKGSSCMQVALERRARIFSRLHSTDNSGHNLETMIVILLGLCAVELIDVKFYPQETGLPALVANAALLVKTYVASGLEISSVAKYFMRAFARLDVIISLMHFQKPSIPPDVWLDEACINLPDRLMGYSATLIPLLAELCDLAEDVRRGSHGEDKLRGFDPVFGPDELLCREASLRLRINAWRPIAPDGTTFKSTGKLLFHSLAYRSAALLYLFRLFSPPGSSPDADQAALSMAHEVLVFTSRPAAELKMSLWPLFIASCELQDEEDRTVATQIYDYIYTYRKTATSLHTKSFCVNRVWKARDEGIDWNWMNLVLIHPGEFLPI